MNQTINKQARLLIVVNVFHPDRGGGGAIFTDLARGLAARGFDVTVRCAYPYYPEWKDKSSKNGWAIERSEEEGVHVERYGIYIPKRPNSLIQRMVYEASFFMSLLRSLPRGRFDMVMVFCPLVGAVGFATLNKWIHWKPLWLNVQDLSADAAAASGIARGKAVRKLFSGIQQKLFNQAQVWSSISPVMIERLRAIRRKNQPILYLPNWLNASMADALQQQENKSGQAPHDPIRLLYAGNIGGKQDLLRFCETLHASQVPFFFRIHGDGGHAETIRTWVEQTKDARFSFGPFLDEPAFAEALHDTDFFVITEKSGSGGSFIPCKMIPGMASGSAILAVSDVESPLGKEMTTQHPGPWFSWSDLESVPALLESIRENPAPFIEWQANARRRAEFHERGRVISRFETAIRSILAQPGSIPTDLADC